MTISVANGSFDTGTTGSVAVTGVGFQPKALIVFGTGKSDETEADNLYAGMGITDGTNHFFRCFEQQNATAGGLNGARQGTSKIYSTIDFSATTLWDFSLTSFDADGFTVNFANSETGNKIHWVALGGASLNAKVGTFATGGSAGSLAVTGVGFLPTIMMCVSGQQGNGLGFGAATSSTERCAQSFTTVSAADPSVAKARQSQAHFVANTNNVTAAHNIDLTSLDADGFTMDKEVDAADATFGYMCLNGTFAKVGSFTQPTSASQQIVHVGFKPKLVIFSTWGKAASGSQQANIEMCFGAATSSSSRRAVYNRAQDALAGTSEAFRKQEVDCCLSIPDQTGAVVAKADFLGSVGNKMALDWTTVDATAREINFIAFGDEVVSENKHLMLLGVG